MARRKQQNPRHLETSQELATSLQNGISSGSDSEDDEHVCGRCRAEFPSLSEFIKHKVSCISKRPVLVLSDEPKNGELDVCSSNEDEEDACPPDLTSISSLFHDSDMEKRYHANLADLPQLVQQLSDTNVTLEQLRNTTVAVAQHGRTMQETQLASLLSNIHLQQVAQLHVIRELQAQILGVPTSPKSVPLVGTAALTPPQSGSESAMGVAAPNGNHPAAPTPARTSINSTDANAQLEESSYEPNTLELLQRHTEQALQNTMAGGSFLLCGVGNATDLSRLKRTKDGNREESLPRHRCKFCGKVFGSDSGLQIHLRSHTGERPFKCTVCGSCFSTKGNLKVHFQRHKERREIPEDFQNGGTNHLPLMNGETHENEKAIDFSGEKNSPPNLGQANGQSGSVTPNEISTLSDDSDDLSENGENELTIHDQRFDEDDDNDSDISGIEDNNLDGEIGILQAMRQPSFPSPTFAPFFRPTSFSGTLSESPMCLPPPTSNASGSDGVYHRDPSLYQELLPRIGSNDNSWESLMEVTETSETSKLQKLVDNIEVTDPNQCIICHRVLSCKSALQMHYRTHTGERPFRCKICGRAFTTKGNLKTHMSVHRHKAPTRLLHQCPVCHKQFANSVILQQHIRMHTAVRGIVMPDSVHFSDNKNTLLPPSYPRPMLMPALLTNSEPLALTNPDFRNHMKDANFQQQCTESVIKATKMELESSRRSCASSPEGSSSSSGSPGSNIAEVPVNEDMKPMCLETTPKSPNAVLQKSSEGPSPVISQTQSSTPADREKSPSERDFNQHHSPVTKSDVNFTPSSQNDTNGLSTVASNPENVPVLTESKEKQKNGNMPLPMMLSLPNDKPLPMTLPSDCPIPFSIQSDRQIIPMNVPCSTADFTASLTALENHVKAINSNTTNPLPFPPPLGLGFIPNFYRQDFGFAYLNKEKHRAYSPPSKNSSDISADESSTPGSLVKSDSPKSVSARSDSGALDLTPRGSSGSTISTNRHTNDLKVFTPLAGLPFPPPHARHGTTCQICFKTFACQSALEIHYRSHTKERPFKCDVCDRGFSTKGNMKQHMLTHKIRDLPPQLFTTTPQAPPNFVSSPIISQCTDFTKKMEELAKRSPTDSVGPHTPSPKRPTGMPKHVCEVCHKPFSSGSALQIHMRTHTGVKPFQCNICSRAFTTKGNLKVHMGTHLSSSGTSRRGRRMSLDISPLSLPLGKLGEYPPHPDMFFPYLPPYLNGMTHPQSKMNEISVIQSAVVNREDAMPSLTAVSMSMAPPSFTTSARPLALVTTPSQKPDLKRPEGETPHISPARSREPCSPGRTLFPTESPAIPERGASWGWKIACNRCNKICSSSTELELHISTDHAKVESIDSAELTVEQKS